jgi:CRISPR-associated exonuclease Cas4
MFGTAVADGALFYGRTKRRKAVTFDEELRALTILAAARFREIAQRRMTPLRAGERNAGNAH